MTGPYGRHRGGDGAKIFVFFVWFVFLYKCAEIGTRPSETWVILVHPSSSGTVAECPFPGVLKLTVSMHAFSAEGYRMK